MDSDTLLTQARLFHKYWYNGAENDNLKDFQIADQLRGKLIPQIDTEVAVEDKAVASDIYADFAEFCFEYLSCLDKLGRDSSAALWSMKAMAEKAIGLNPDSFFGHYFLAVHHSWNLKRAHAGNMPATYKGEDAASSIVGTAFNLLFKGITLGATATAAGVSNAYFTTSVQNLVTAYRKILQPNKVEAGYYVKATSRMFTMAEYCEDVNNRVWRDIYVAIRDFDTRKLDYSGLEEKDVPDFMEAVMEFKVIADSKI